MMKLEKVLSGGGMMVTFSMDEKVHEGGVISLKMESSREPSPLSLHIDKNDAKDLRDLLDYFLEHQA